jgi:hypothetical protein
MQSETVLMLTRLWTVTNPTPMGSPTKRGRNGDSDQLSPVIASHGVVHHGCNAASTAVETPQQVADPFFGDLNDESVRDFDMFHRSTGTVTSTW